MGFDPNKKYDKPDFEPLEKGWHLAYITQAILGRSSKGDPMLSIRYEVIGDGKGVGRKMFEHFVLTDKHFWKLQEFVLAARKDLYARDADHPDGFPRFEDGETHEENQKAIQNWLIGRPFSLRVKGHKREDYKGEVRMREQIDSFQPLNTEQLDRLETQYTKGQGELTPELPDDAYATERKKAEGNGSSGGGGRTTEAEPGPGYSDSDIPF